MRRAQVFYGETLSGILTETDDGEYQFQYDGAYTAQYPAQFITFTMPVKTDAYISKNLFPFFNGLIPEGWLLDIASKSWKISYKDRMGLLLACCRNCIGAVSVVQIPEEDAE